jgi:hypothetical protein
VSLPGFTIRPDEILEQMKQLPNTRADRERGPPAVRFPRFRGFQIDETPRKSPRLRLVQQQLRASSQWRQTASVLPPGVPQGIRRSSAAMGRRSDSHRGADRRRAQEWPCTNARVGGGCSFARGPPVRPACGAPRRERRRASEGFRRVVGPDHHGAPTRLRSSPGFITAPAIAAITSC